MEYFAHIRRLENGKEQRQTVTEHCRNTAAYAQKCVETVGLAQSAYLAGLLHDAGKCKAEFQDYLIDGEGLRGSVNHTFAGCRMILEHFHGEYSQRFEDASAELLAYAVGAHHGLFDCVDPQHNSGFLVRMEKEKINYQESCENYLASCANWNEIEERFEKSNRELSDLCKKLLELSDRNHDETREEFQFYLGLLARLLLSAVIEGDRRDTAMFMNGTNPPHEPENEKDFWNRYLYHVENKLSALPKNSTLQRARAAISEQCRNFAKTPEGVFRLNVPTGGGKTLSSLRYALAHAAAWRKKRIIFVTPLLSILEQNAQVIREYIGDDSIILEHHSNVIQPDDAGDHLDFRELAIESWHTPVIITTMVQLLNTFFQGKTTSVRRFQSLCDAVVVIDEVQSVPNHMLTLFNLTINFLSELCHTTFLLCSATQPCFEQAVHPLLNEPKEAVPFEKKLWEPFGRTYITDAGRKQLKEIPDFIRKILEETDSLLVICNKKSEAEFLYQRLAGELENCFHLSASMCMAHRRATLQQINRVLAKQGEKIVCIATQVIEAGVDISFQRVIRLAAGMDSIVQAAGRCNRNGESQSPVPVYVVQCTDENLGKLWEIQRAKTVTIALLEEFRRDPEIFQNNLVSDNAIRWYYHNLYRNMESGFQDYPLKKEQNTLFSMLGSNIKYYTEDCSFFGKYSLIQAFRTAGYLFHVFDENTQDVVVPYGEGEDLIAQLASLHLCSVSYLREWSRRAKPYTITIYDYQKQLLGPALYCVNGVLVLRPEAYDQHTGLSWEKGPTYLEV